MTSYALCGNPNCGKSTLFNRLCGAHRHTGNYAGVTVDRGIGHFTHKGIPYQITDLPGAYSLSAETEDERQLFASVASGADGLIHVVEAAALVRALPLTLELLALRRPSVLLLNMADELPRRGVKINTEVLSALLGIPVFPICAKTGVGIQDFLDGLDALPTSSPCPYSAKEIAAAVWSEDDKPSRSDSADRILLHPAIGFPLLAMLVALLFWLVFGPPGAWLSRRFSLLLDRLISAPLAALLAGSVHPLLRDYLLHGILDGVGGVLTFLPQIALLFFSLAILEDSGILARIAFLCDAPLRRFGLTGRAAIPLSVAFGCSVPAVLSARIADEDTKKRLHTILPLLSCPARAPIYAMILPLFFPLASAFFLPGIYAFGLAIALLLAKLLSIGKPPMPPLVLEFPPYRMPLLRNVLYAAWDKCRAFLIRAGTVIFLAASGIWLLEHLGTGGLCSNLSESLLYRIGETLSPLFKPLGFGRPIPTAALLCGVFAKESILSALLILCRDGSFFAELGTPGGALAFLTFVSLYCPCIATLDALRQERGCKTAVWIALLHLLIAYGCAFCINLFFSLFCTNLLLNPTYFYIFFLLWAHFLPVLRCFSWFIVIEYYVF